VRCPDIAGAFKQRRDGAKNGLGMITLGPQRYQTVFIQKHRRQISLRIQVGRDYVDAEIRIHPGKMVRQRGLSHPALVVENAIVFIRAPRRPTPLLAAAQHESRLDHRGARAG